MSASPDIEYFQFEADEDRELAAATRDRSAKDLQALSEDLDVAKLVLKIAGKRIKNISIEDAVIDGQVTRTILGTSNIQFRIHDQAREILKSGNLTDENGRLVKIIVELDGLWFHLAKYRKEGDDLLLEFEDYDVGQLRELKGPRLVGTRGNITRAQAVEILIKSVKGRKIKHHINELKKAQPIDRANKREKEEIRDRKRSKGFSRGVILDGKGPLNKTELDNAARALAVADSLNSPDLATLAMIEACIVEAPDFQNPTGGEGTSAGILQLTDIHNLSIEKRREIEYVIHRFLAGPSFTGAESGAGAIELARRRPDWSAGQIAQTIQGSGYGERYDQYRTQAQRILKEWGTTGGGLSRGQIFKPYKFWVKRDETYWDAILRWAKEVEWRAFFSGGEFYYISEEDLYASRSRYTLIEGEDGISLIDGEQDYRKKYNKLSVQARLHRWQVPPGTICTVAEMGSMDGRYLVETISRSLYSPEATIDAKTPTPELPEPRPEVRQQGGGAVSPDNPEVNIDGGAAEIVNQAISIAISNGGSGVYVGNTKRDPVKLSGGSYEDHAEFNRMRAAADIGVRGVDMLHGPPPKQLDRAVVALGRAFGRDYGNGTSGAFQNADNIQYRGFRIQIIWRTPEWGGHMGHIHFGVRSNEQNASTLSGLPSHPPQLS